MKNLTDVLSFLEDNLTKSRFDEIKTVYEYFYERLDYYPLSEIDRYSEKKGFVNYMLDAAKAFKGSYKVYEHVVDEVPFSTDELYTVFALRKLGIVGLVDYPDQDFDLEQEKRYETLSITERSLYLSQTFGIRLSVFELEGILGKGPIATIIDYVDCLLDVATLDKDDLPWDDGEDMVVPETNKDDISSEVAISKNVPEIEEPETTYTDEEKEGMRDEVKEKHDAAKSRGEAAASFEELFGIDGLDY